MHANAAYVGANQSRGFSTRSDTESFDMHGASFATPSPTHRTEAPRYHLDLPLGLWDGVAALPRWYKFFSAVGVACVFQFSESKEIQQVVAAMHVGLGTDQLWHPSYRSKLQAMTIHQRLVLATVAVLVVALVLVCRGVARRHLDVSLSPASIVPNHPRVSFGVAAAVVIEVILVMGETLRHSSRDESFTAALAPSYLPSEWAAHARVHEQAALHMASWFVSWVVAPVMVAASFRLFRDVARGRSVHYRWHVATVLWIKAACIVSSWVISDSFDVNFTPLTSFLGIKSDMTLSYAPFATVLSAVLMIAALNYSVGVAGRAGVEIASTAGTAMVTLARHSLSVLLMYAFLVLCVYTAVIGSHVVELIALWLVTFMMLLWIPSAVLTSSIMFACCFGSCVALAQYTWAPVELSLLSVLRRSALAGTLACSSLLSGGILVRCIYGICGPRASRWLFTATFVTVLSVAIAEPMVDIFSAAYLPEALPSVRATDVDSSSEATLRQAFLQLVSAALRVAESRQWLIIAAADGVLVFVIACAVAGSASFVAATTQRQYGRSAVQMEPPPPSALGPAALLALRSLVAAAFAPSYAVPRFARATVIIVILSVSTASGWCVSKYALPAFVHSELKLAAMVVVTCVALGSLMDLEDAMTTILLRVAGWSRPPSESVSSASPENNSSFSPDGGNLFFPHGPASDGALSPTPHFSHRGGL